MVIELQRFRLADTFLKSGLHFFLFSQERLQNGCRRHLKVACMFQLTLSACVCSPTFLERAGDQSWPILKVWTIIDCAMYTQKNVPEGQTNRQTNGKLQNLYKDCIHVQTKISLFVSIINFWKIPHTSYAQLNIGFEHVLIDAKTSQRWGNQWYRFMQMWEYFS